MQDCALIDAGFQGDPFTWKKGNMEVRLDRCIINLAWRIRFKQAFIQHLRHLKSDHRPLLLYGNKNIRRNLRIRPFRFEAAWLTHEMFPSFMRDHWLRNEEVQSWNGKVNKLHQDLGKWNREVFGCIFSKKRELLSHLEDLDYQRSVHNNNLLEKEYINTWREYETVLAEEEILWFQKSRVHWIQQGDRNTKYFHGVTPVRRSRNKYDMLQDDSGTWVKDQTQIELLATNYYKSLLLDEEQFKPYFLSRAFPTIDENEANLLEQRVTREEIFQTIKKMGSFKASGPDGLQAIFYKNQWHVVGDDLCDLVGKIFDDPSLVQDKNKTLITLIPKKDMVISMRDFRPISLCIVSYKVITKIVTQRLRGIMGNLIGPCQSSFVPNRQSGDNVIVAQEVFHSMTRKSGNKGWMAIKIDLEKAYDKLKWSFIKDTLIDIGIPKKNYQPHLALHIFS